MQAPCLLANKSESCSVSSNASLVSFLLEAMALINKILKLLVGDTNFREHFITICVCECKLKSFDLPLERSEVIPGNLRKLQLATNFRPPSSLAM